VPARTPRRCFVMDASGSALATRPLLAVEGLVKHFVLGGFLKRGTSVVRAVDGISFSIGQRETLALVGESGCGKSTTGRLVMRLIEPTAGSILYEGEELTELDGRRLLPYRRKLQIIFQDPYGSLNPRMTVADILGEPIRIHGIASGAEVEQRVARLLDMVGLPASHARRYPHEFSGGQRQRVGIARALALEPRLVVCDEPVSALDVSIQAQIVNLLEDIQAELGLSYLFISHDLMVVRHMANRVAVMYLGRIVEEAPTDELFKRPRHPYTRALLDVVPVPDPERERTRPVVEGDVPSPVAPPPGCHFHPRCEFAVERCRTTAPPLEADEGSHAVACHRWRELPIWAGVAEAHGTRRDTRMEKLQAAFAAGKARQQREVG
jgi:oligopeptide/dipeptide ABC transporter ATP-binding protein